MQLLFLAPEILSYGGIQRQNRLVIAALDEILGAEQSNLTVLVLNDSTPANIPSELTSLQSTDIHYFDGDRIAYLRKYVQESRFADLTLYGLLGFSLMSFVQLSANRRLLMLYGIEAWYRRSFWHSLAVKRMDDYIAISQHTMDKFRVAYDIKPTPQQFILPNVVSPELLGLPQIDVNNGELSTPVLLTVSAMRSHDQPKGIDTVIRALPNLITKFPGLRYIVVGDGSDRKRLEHLAEERGVASFVDFRGKISDSDLKEAYRRCDVFVLPSAKEGFGFVFIEAMAYGKPIVAARAGATPEVVRDGETGFLIDYDNDAQLVKVLSHLFESSELRQQMGEAGIKLIQTRYSYQALKANLSQIFFSR